MIDDVVRDAIAIVASLADGHDVVRGVRHPLGFICLPVRRGGQFGVCVHVWSRELVAAVSTTSAVHSHSWDLESRVLYGHVGNSTVRIFDDVDRATHRVFEVHSAGDVDELRATGRLVRPVAERSDTAGPGETYRLAGGLFHTTVIEGDSEAATVAIGRTVAAADLSLGPIDGVNHRIVRQRCGAEETASTARIVLRQMLGGGEKDGEVNR